MTTPALREVVDLIGPDAAMRLALGMAGRSIYLPNIGRTLAARRRRLEVSVLRAAGLTSPEIAGIVGHPERTVRTLARRPLGEVLGG